MFNWWSSYENQKDDHNLIENCGGSQLGKNALPN